MNSRSAAITGVLLALMACNQRTTDRSSSHDAQPTNVVRPEPQPPVPPPGSGPDAKTPLGEQRGAVDSKSAKAARQLVEGFGALVEQGHFEDAKKLWGDPRAESDFIRMLRPGTQLEIGEAAQPEGAAGSIYITVPVVFHGHGLHRPAKVILRRVNDVPGSTAEQRRWHIERIDWAPN